MKRKPSEKALAVLKAKAFKPGQSGNPAAVPKAHAINLPRCCCATSARSERGGLTAIQTVVAERPQDFLRAVVSNLPLTMLILLFGAG